jgi:hypothetical protein
MKARNLKPGAFKNEILGTGPIQALPFFLALSLQADSVGIVEDRPLRLWAEAFPYRHWGEADELLDYLAENGMIVRYTSSEGQRLIYIPTFLKHQRPHKDEKASIYLTPLEEAKKRQESREISRDFQWDTQWSREIPQGFPPESGLPSPLTPDSPSSEGGLTSTLTHRSAEEELSEAESPCGGQVQDVDFPAGPRPSAKMSVSEAMAHPAVQAVVSAWKVICTPKEESVFLEPSPGLIAKKAPEIIAASEADPNWLKEALEVIAWAPTSDFNSGRVPPLKEGGDPFVLTFAGLTTTGMTYRKHAEMHKDLEKKARLAKAAARAAASGAGKKATEKATLTDDALTRKAKAQEKKDLAKKELEQKELEAQAELDRLEDELADSRSADEEMERAHQVAQEMES